MSSTSSAGRGGKLILPPLRRTAVDARKFAEVVHRGQLDKAGRPYAEHPARVSAEVCDLADGCSFWGAADFDMVEQIAWLHDVVEDVEDGEDRLEAEGFSDEVIEAVCWLSRNRARDPAGSYADWITEIATLAPLPVILVKLADVEDNGDPERLALLPEETRERLLRKYEPAKEVLRAAARQKGWQG